ncbi:MAG: Serine/threonine-protein kinase CtkA [Firmicutes bacterium ADurb.Bin419]|nr:MAG: Serine/threonine-protein kinase CtkA [Firmicutes bacterium ADurb.Bin419]
MSQLINFDIWHVDEEHPFGSGASEKKWLINPNTKQTGIFKFPKIMSSGEITGEYWAEKLASDIALLIGIDCAKVDIGIYHDRIGSMSYNVLEPDEELIEGIQYIVNKYPNYNGDRFIDTKSGKIYSIQMILESLKGTGLERDFLKIPIFDALIGNSDRHHSNWAVKKNIQTGEIRISPLYDNGSSLCCLVSDSKVQHYMGSLLNFESLVYGKSKSIIGWQDVKKPRHLELIQNIAENYYDDTISIINRIEETLSEDSIKRVVYRYEDMVITNNIKKLLCRFLIERKNRIVEIYKKKEGDHE